MSMSRKQCGGPSLTVFKFSESLEQKRSSWTCQGLLARQCGHNTLASTFLGTRSIGVNTASVALASPSLHFSVETMLHTFSCMCVCVCKYKFG